MRYSVYLHLSFIGFVTSSFTSIHFLYHVPPPYSCRISPPLPPVPSSMKCLFGWDWLRAMSIKAMYLIRCFISTFILLTAFRFHVTANPETNGLFTMLRATSRDWCQSSLLDSCRTFLWYPILIVFFFFLCTFSHDLFHIRSPEHSDAAWCRESSHVWGGWSELLHCWQWCETHGLRTLSLLFLSRGCCRGFCLTLSGEKDCLQHRSSRRRFIFYHEGTESQFNCVFLVLLACLTGRLVVFSIASRKEILLLKSPWSWVMMKLSWV